MTLRKRENTGNWITLWKLALEEALDLLWDRLRDYYYYYYVHENRKTHSKVILYSDQQMHNYFTNYDTATCFDTIVTSSDNL
jgi:hypothetical protein